MSSVYPTRSCCSIIERRIVRQKARTKWSKIKLRSQVHDANDSVVSAWIPRISFVTICSMIICSVLFFIASSETPLSFYFEDVQSRACCRRIKVSLPPSVGLLRKNLLFEDDRTKKSGKKVEACRAIRRDNAVPVLETGVCVHVWKNMFAVLYKVSHLLMFRYGLRHVSFPRNLLAKFCSMNTQLWIASDWLFFSFFDWSIQLRIIIHSTTIAYNSERKRNAKSFIIDDSLSVLKMLLHFTKTHQLSWRWKILRSRVYEISWKIRQNRCNINAVMNLLAGGKCTKKWKLN